MLLALLLLVDLEKVAHLSRWTIAKLLRKREGHILLILGVEYGLERGRRLSLCLLQVVTPFWMIQLNIKERLFILNDFSQRALNIL